MSNRVLFVVKSLYPMGPAQQMLLLARHLIVHEYDVHVAVLEERENDPVLPGLTIHPLRKLPHRDTGLTLRLRRLIQRLKPNLVHAWCQPAISECGAAMFELEFGRLICSELCLNDKPSFLTKQLRRRLHQRPQKVTVAHQVLLEAQKRDGIRKHRLVIVPTAAFHPPHDPKVARRLLRQRFDLPDEARVAGTFAVLEPRTQLKDLIWATDLLTCIRDDFHLVIFGEGHQESRLRKFLSHSNASHAIHFGGTPADADALLSGLDFYWHSHLQNPLDGVLLAAMHAGIPVVSVFGDGLREIVLPQTTALGTNFGARDEFARWTKYLIEQPESATRLAIQGRDHVQKEFPLSRMIKGFEGVYNWCD